ncbi:hypothetical protein AcW1_003783 [Taiwanofungus camphoratus]|nr:hypothetical protein AcW1_003783 [Antrodia cinnamomea]
MDSTALRKAESGRFIHGLAHAVSLVGLSIETCSAVSRCHDRHSEPEQQRASLRIQAHSPPRTQTHHVCVDPDKYADGAGPQHADKRLSRLTTWYPVGKTVGTKEAC